MRDLRLVPGTFVEKKFLIFFFRVRPDHDNNDITVQAAPVPSNCDGTFLWSGLFCGTRMLETKATELERTSDDSSQTG
jgi:hypothetical protein